MAILKLNGDTSGYVILQAASVAQNNVLTLPNVTDTLLSSNNPVMSNASINGSTLLNATLAGSGTITGTLSGGTLANTTLSSPNILGSWSQQNLNLVGTSALVGNGVYIPAVNTVGFITNTTERMRLTAGGNLLVNSTALATSGNATVVISGIGTNGGGLQLSGGAAGGVSEQSLNGGGVTWNTYTGAVGAESYTERMRLDSNGNLGVGVSTLSLGGRLTVGKPAVTSFTGSASGVVTVSDTSSTLNSYTALDFTNTNQQLPLARIAMQFTSSGSYLSLGTTNSYGSGVNNTAMTIDPTGKVGIGTAAPGVTLDLIGNTGAVAAPTYLNQTSFAFRNNFHTRMAMVNPGSPYVSQLSSYTTGAAFPNQTLTFGTSSTFLFENGDGTAATTEKMRITSTGNVGIATTTVTAPLHVFGTNTGTGQASPGAIIARFMDGQQRNSVTINGGIDGNTPATNAALNIGGGAALTWSLSTTHGVNLATAFAGSGSTGLVVQGYVGINDTSPGANLTVGNGTGSTSLFVYGNVSGSKNSYVRLTDTSGTSIGLAAVLGGVTKVNIEGGTGASYFNGGGNVGINSTTPVAALDVQGNVNVAGTVIMGSSFLRNRIINGAMQIAQRVSTNIQTGLTNGVFYIADRFYFQNATGATVSAQQSSTAPAGFNNSFYVTVTSSGTPGYGFIQQNIEGYNLADFALGTSSAKAFTVSFWVYSNLTGIYSVSIQTSTYDYSYNATYTINASNTWQYVILAIPGTALGTWYTDNRQGMAVRFSLINSGGGTPNAWVSGSQNGSTNNVNWFASNGNTFYLTGVQLEIGSVATPFERKLFDQILIDCQRYYEKSYDVTVVPGTSTSTNAFSLIASSSLVRYPAFFKVTKRIVNGTITFYSTTGASGNIRNNSAASDLAVSTVTGSVNGYASSNGGTTNNEYIGQWTIDAEY